MLVFYVDSASNAEEFQEAVPQKHSRAEAGLESGDR
jgi:hypothetical protein